MDKLVKQEDEVIIGWYRYNRPMIATWHADKGWVIVEQDQLPSRRYLDSLGLRRLDEQFDG